MKLEYITFYCLPQFFISKGDFKMNLKTKTNTVKQILTKVMLVVFLMTSTLSLTSCGGIFTYDWEVYSHEEFLHKVSEYNSIHNVYVDTFISFDLDSNEEVSERIYYFIAGTKKKMHDKTLYDIHNNFYRITQVFYLNSDEYVHTLKITCKYDRIDNNFTEEDRIEIKSFSNHFACEYDDQYYQSSLVSDKSQVKIYKYVYRYEIYVNDSEIACIHISSRYESNEEELNRIIKMLEDSLVVINTENNFIWRDKE